MPLRPLASIALAAGAAVALTPAIAGTAAPSREAADKTLGMAIMTAVVSADGALARGTGVIDVLGGSNPAKSVRFARNVRDCSYFATIGLPAADSLPPSGQIGVVGASAYTDGVLVMTYDKDGIGAARGFHLQVFCPQ